MCNSIHRIFNNKESCLQLKSYYKHQKEEENVTNLLARFGVGFGLTRIFYSINSKIKIFFDCLGWKGWTC